MFFNQVESFSAFGEMANLLTLGMLICFLVFIIFFSYDLFIFLLCFLLLLTCNY